MELLIVFAEILLRPLTMEEKLGRSTAELQRLVIEIIRVPFDQ